METNFLKTENNSPHFQYKETFSYTLYQKKKIFHIRLLIKRIILMQWFKTINKIFNLKIPILFFIYLFNKLFVGM